MWISSWDEALCDWGGNVWGDSGRFHNNTNHKVSGIFALFGFRGGRQDTPRGIRSFSCHTWTPLWAGPMKGQIYLRFTVVTLLKLHWGVTSSISQMHCQIKQIHFIVLTAVTTHCRSDGGMRNQRLNGDQGICVFNISFLCHIKSIHIQTNPKYWIIFLHSGTGRREVIVQCLTLIFTF